MTPAHLRRLHHWLQVPREGLELSSEAKDIFPMTGYCSLLGVVAHTSNLPLFYLLGFPSLMAFNVFSVICFVLAILLWRRGRQQAAWTLIVLEVLIHACYCCFVLGWNSSFHYPITLLIPIVFLATGFSPWAQVAAGVGIVGSYLVLYSVCPVNVASVSQDLTQALSYYNLAILFCGMAGISAYYGVAVRSSRAAVAREFERAEGLLLNVLPKPIADRLKADEGTIADDFEACTVLFADIVGFTPLSAKLNARQLVGVLNDIFSKFDDVTEELGLEKIKTIGDNYMVAAGIPEPRPDHAAAIAKMALRMREIIQGLGAVEGETINIRIGFHSGAAVAGVIGKQKFIYDLWGDTVNTAARMESHGRPGEIQLSADTKGLLGDGFTLEERGEIEVKGKGTMHTYFLLSEA